MKVSKLIEILKELEEKHGDVEVYKSVYIDSVGFDVPVEYNTKPEITTEEYYIDELDTFFGSRVEFIKI